MIPYAIPVKLTELSENTIEYLSREKDGLKFVKEYLKESRIEQNIEYQKENQKENETQKENHYQKNYEIFIQKQNQVLLDLEKYNTLWYETLEKAIEYSANNGLSHIDFNIKMFILNFRFSNSQLKFYFKTIFDEYLKNNDLKLSDNYKIDYSLLRLDNFGNMSIRIVINDFFTF